MIERTVCCWFMAPKTRPAEELLTSVTVRLVLYRSTTSALQYSRQICARGSRGVSTRSTGEGKQGPHLEDDDVVDLGDAEEEGERGRERAQRVLVAGLQQRQVRLEHAREEDGQVPHEALHLRVAARVHLDDVRLVRQQLAHVRNHRLEQGHELAVVLRLCQGDTIEPWTTASSNAATYCRL